MFTGINAGVFYALARVFSTSSESVFNKKLISKLNPFTINLFVMLFVGVCVAPLLFLLNIPALNKTFWIALFITIILNLIANILFIKSYLSDLSIISPISAFKPAFTLIAAIFILKEIPSVLGIFGILLIVFGSYFIMYSKQDGLSLKPLKRLLSDKGVQLNFLAMLTIPFSSSFDKMAINISGPLIFTPFFILLSIPFSLLAIHLFVPKKIIKRDSLVLFKSKKEYLFLGLSSVGAYLFTALAFSKMFVAYASALFQLAVVIEIFFGYYIFKEKGILQRLVAGTIMILGVIFILLA